MSRVIDAFAQFFDETGSPLINGWLEFLVSGSNNTKKPTYADSSQTIPNENPLQLDAGGNCPNVFGQGAYRVRLYTKNPVTGLPGDLIKEVDPVTADYSQISAGNNFEEWNGTTFYQVGNIVNYLNNYYTSLGANNVGNVPSASSVWWEQVSFLRNYNPNVVYEYDDVVVLNSVLYFSLSDSNQGNDPSTSPTWWGAVGGGTVLLQWEEYGTIFRPKTNGQYLGDDTHMLGDVYIQDASKIYLGDDQDFEIYHDGANSRIVTNTGNIIFNAVDAGSYVHFMVANALKWSINSSGTLYPFLGDAQDIGAPGDEIRSIYIGTAGKLFLGNTQFELSHDGSDAYIVNNFGDLNLLNSVYGWVINSSGYLYPNDDLDIGLSTNPVRSIYFGEIGKIFLGLSQQLEISYSANIGYIYCTSPLYIGTLDTSIFAIRTNNILRWNFDGSGHFMPWTSNAYNIGSTTYLVKDVYIGDSGKINLGNSQDLRVFHNGTASYILNSGSSFIIGTSSYNGFYLRSNGVSLLHLSAQGNLDPEIDNHTSFGYSSRRYKYIHVMNIVIYTALKLNDNVHLYLGSDNDLDIYFDGTAARILNTGTVFYLGTISNHNVYFRTASLDRWIVSGTDGHFYPVIADTYNLGSTTNEIANIYVGQAGRVYLGLSQQFQIYFNGSTAYILQDGSAIYIGTRSTHTFGVMVNNTVVWAFFSDGDLAPYVADSYDIGGPANEIKNVYVGEVGKIYLGLDQDFSIYHNGTNSYVENTTGSLYIKTNSTTNIIFSTNNTVRWLVDSDGILRPTTTSPDTYDLGANNAEIRSIYVGEAGKIYLGLDQDMQVYHNGTNGFVVNSTGYLRVGTSGSGFLYLLSNGSIRWGINTNGDLFPYVDDTYSIGGVDNVVKSIYVGEAGKIYLGLDQDFEIYFNSSDSFIISNTGSLRLGTYSTDSVYFRTNNTNRWQIDSSGNLLPVTTITYNIGGTSNFIKNIYQGDNGVHSFGNSQDLIMLHDGSNGYIKNGTGNLTIGTTASTLLSIITSNTTRWVFNSDGDFRPNSTSAYDIGSNTYRAQTVYSGAFSSDSNTITADSDAADVTGKSILKVNSVSGNITLGGLSGGVIGQFLLIVKATSSNNVIIEHNESTGTEKIFLSTAADVTLTNYGGILVFFDGTNWMEVGH